MSGGIAYAQIPTRYGASLGRRNSEHTRAFAACQRENDFDGRSVAVENSVTLHHANGALGIGHLVTTADATIHEERIALAGAPPIGQSQLKALAVRLHTRICRIAQGERMRYRRLTLAHVHELVPKMPGECVPHHRLETAPGDIESLLGERCSPRVHPPIAPLPHHGGHLPEHQRHIAEMHDNLTVLRTVEESAKARDRRQRDAMRLHRGSLDDACAEHARCFDSIARELEMPLAVRDASTRQERRQLTLERRHAPHCAVYWTRMHRRLPTQREHTPALRKSGAPAARLRAIFGTTLVLSILTLASACDKHKTDDEKPQTSLGGKPRTLVFLFGDKDEPRMLPVAMLDGNHVLPITLDSSGWHNFDKLYFESGSQFSVYQRGLSIGTATVKRGMWETRNPLYRLPGCRSPRPLAAASLAAKPEGIVMFEMLATSDSLPTVPKRTLPVKADQDSAKAFAARAAHKEGFTNKARLELDEVLQVIPTGATTHPTIVAAYLEKGSGLTGKPRHVFVIGDYVDAQQSYVTSFAHVVGDSIPEFRRYVDHLDLTGDGVDEIVLEGWQREGESFLVILRYQNSHWREVLRTRASWCDDGVKL